MRLGVLESRGGVAGERPYASPSLPATCARCALEADGACRAHSVSPCTWVLGAPNDPIDIVQPCDMSCCPDRDAPELCVEFALDPSVAAEPLCPKRRSDGRVDGHVAWREPNMIGFVLAQARGLVTTNSEHSALTDRKTGAWSMAGVPHGDVVFSFYAGARHVRVACSL